MFKFFPMLGLVLALALQTAHAAGVDPTQPPAVSVPRSQTSELYYNLLVGETAARRDLVEQALEHYEAALALSDDARVASRATALALYLENHDAVLRSAQRWLALDPGDPGALQAMPLALFKLDKFDQAIEQLDLLRAARSEDGTQGFGSARVLLSRLNDAALAQRALEALAERHPTQAEAWHQLALLYLANDQSESALNALARALTLRPNHAETLLLHAQVLIRQHPQEAETALSAIRTQIEHANEQLDDLQLGLARLLTSAERFDEAEREFRRILERHPEHPDALYALGAISASDGRTEQARDLFSQLAASGQATDDVLFELGRLEEAQGNYKQAREWYLQVSSPERFLAAQVRVGALQAREGDLEGMTQRFEVLRQQNPDNVIALHLAEAEVLRELEHYQRAWDQLTSALQGHAADPDLLYSRALIAERLDRLDLLEQDLRTIIAADPDHGHALNALGYTLVDRTDRLEEAEDLLIRAYDLLPDDAAVIDSVGWLYYRLGRYQEALTYLERAYALQNDAEIAVHLIQVLWKLDRHDEARTLYDTTQHNDPDSRHLDAVRPLFEPSI